VDQGQKLAAYGNMAGTGTALLPSLTAGQITVGAGRRKQPTSL